MFHQIEGKFKRFSVAWKRGILFVSCGLRVCEQMSVFKEQFTMSRTIPSASEQMLHIPAFLNLCSGQGLGGGHG